MPDALARGRERQRARWRACAKLGLYIHITAYVLVNLLLLAINLLVTPGRLWFLWPLAGWGVGVIFHAVSVIFVPRVVDRMTANELERQREKK